MSVREVHFVSLSEPAEVGSVEWVVSFDHWIRRSLVGDGC